MLEPAPEDRFQSAQQLISSLKGEDNTVARFGGNRFDSSRRSQLGNDDVFDITSAPATRFRNRSPGTVFKQGNWGLQRRTRGGTLLKKPAGSNVQLTRTGGTLSIYIPPSKFSAEALATGGFAIAWNSFIGVWTFGAVSGGALAAALFSIPVCFVCPRESKLVLTLGVYSSSGWRELL